MADISRSELSTIIEEEYSHELLDSAMANSVALQAFRRVDMGTKTKNLPVLATLPEAGFVTESADETGVKPTAQATWGNKQLVAEEIAVIIPIHENVVDDATVDALDEITKAGGAAIGRKLDGAVLFGVDKPVTWTSDDLSAAATAAGQTVEVAAHGEDDLIGSILQAAGLVDEAGWEPSDVLAPRGLRYRLANLRAGASDGTPVFLPSLSNTPGSVDTLAGLTGRWVTGRVWDRDEAEALVVDAERVIIGVRQDISVKFLSEATVGGLNLAERDMVALRFKARYAYVLGDGTNAESNSTNCPVGMVTPVGS